MSFEDDEYWESEYDDGPRRSRYTDTAATARDPYADAVLARWGADTRRPAQRTQYIEDDNFGDAPDPVSAPLPAPQSAPVPTPASTPVNSFDPGVDELAERRRQRREAGYQRSPNRDKRISSAFDGERPGWLDDPSFAPADLDAAPVSPGAEGWQRRSLDFDELEYDDREFDAQDWEEQRRHIAARRNQPARDRDGYDPRTRRDVPEAPDVAAGRARVSPDERRPDPRTYDTPGQDRRPPVRPGQVPSGRPAAAQPGGDPRIARPDLPAASRPEPWSEQPAAAAAGPQVGDRTAETGTPGEGPRVKSRATPPTAPRVISKATPPATPRVIKKAEPPAPPRVVDAPPQTAAPRVVTPAPPNVPKTPAASADVLRPASPAPYDAPADPAAYDQGVHAPGAPAGPRRPRVGFISPSGLPGEAPTSPAPLDPAALDRGRGPGPAPSRGRPGTPPPTSPAPLDPAALDRGRGPGPAPSRGRPGTPPPPSPPPL
ncbi:hypothetical protein ABZU58_38585, partial [Actinoplanes sp. NPDC005259]